MMNVPASGPDEPLPSAPLDATPADHVLPPVTRRHDRVLPLLVVLSLVAHVAIVAPSLFHEDDLAQAPREIPVDLVQLPPEPQKPPAPKQAAAPKQPPGKPAPPKQSSPKQESPKPTPPKPTPPKPAPPKPAPPKPAPPKPAPPKPPPPPKPTPPQPTPPKPAPHEPEPAKPPPSQVPGKETPPGGADRYKSLIGAMPAFALPSAGADGTDEVSYTQLVLSQVAKAKKEGRFRGMPGAASVAFTIDDKGGLARVEIVRPSGIADLDAEAIAMIRRGAPYPPPPPGGRRDYTITLRFQPLI